MQSLRIVPPTKRRTIRMLGVIPPVLLVLIGLLSPWSTDDSAVRGFLGSGEARADESSDLSALVRSFQVEADGYNELVLRFRNRLDARAAESASDACADAELLELASACVLSYSRARLVNGLISDRINPGTADNERRAATEATRVFQELPPAHSAPLELIDRGGCQAHEVAAGMLRESKAAASGRQERLGYLRDLLWEATSEAEAAGEAAVEVESFDAPEGSVTSAPEPALSEWNQPAFQRFVRDFDAIYPEVPRHARDFFALLSELAVWRQAGICDEPGIASSYAALSDGLDELSVDYAAIVEIVGRGTVSPEEVRIITAGAADPPKVSSLPVEAQLEFNRLSADWQRALALGRRADDELGSRAPTCDTEELYDRGKQIGEQGQDPETGLDAGAVSAGGGGVSGDAHMRSVGEANVQTFGESRPDCSGGALTYSVSANTVNFPDVIRQQETHTISVPVTWSSSGAGIEGVTIAVLLAYSPNAPAVPITDGSLNGSRTFTFAVDTSAMDFSLGHAAIVVTVQAAIQCGSDSGDGTTVITQPYSPHSGN